MPTPTTRADPDAETSVSAVDAGKEPIEITLRDGRLTLPVPPGYCAVTRDTPDLAASFLAVEAAFGKATCLLGWFVDCRTLAAVRDGGAPVSSLFGGYGVYVSPISETGELQHLPGLTRAEFVERISGTLPSFDREVLSVTIGKSQPIDDGDGAIRLATREIGLLGADAQAYYLATAAELTLDGERRALAGVAATTLLHRVTVSTIVYGGLEDNGTLAALERQAHAATLALIAANPGGDDGGRGFSPDADRLLLIGFGIGLAFVATGRVNLAWKLWCRRDGLRP